MFWALEDLEAAGEIDDRQACLARLAAWFHDAVYDARALPGANEADSAAYAVDPCDASPVRSGRSAPWRTWCG